MKWEKNLEKPGWYDMNWEDEKNVSLPYKIKAATYNTILGQAMAKQEYAFS